MNYLRTYFLSILAFIIVLLMDGYVVTAFGIGLTVFVTIDFIEKIGKTIPVLEAMLFVACLQWVAGPYIDYLTGYKHFKYYMYVPEDQYMELVVPAIFLFALPIYFVANRVNYGSFIERIQKLSVTDKFSFQLIAVGVLADLAGGLVPASVSFLFFLASGVKFVGLLFLFYSNSRRKWLAFFVVLPFQFVLALRDGVFHSLLLWMVFLLLFVGVFYSFSFGRKLLLIAVGFSALLILQSIKAEFRKRIWQDSFSGNRSELFITLFFGKAESFISGEENQLVAFEDDAELEEANNRLNQGWIISRIMQQIPARRPFLEGETVREAINASLVPRFLVESKASGGGGRLTYEKLTGFRLLSASMGTGILGEAYGNYGVNGTYLFMFTWGTMLSLFYLFIFNRAKVIHSLPLFLPIIFFQVIKAETDLFTVLNHLVKSTLFVFGFIYFAIYLFKARF